MLSSKEGRTWKETEEELGGDKGSLLLDTYNESVNIGGGGGGRGREKLSSSSVLFCMLYIAIFFCLLFVNCGE